MRRVRMVVGSKPVGESVTWAYPNGKSLGLFVIPTYQLTISGTDAGGKPVTRNFEVFRFGVECKDGTTPRVVGLAEHQIHTIKAWLPDYRVHSAASVENGAWQVYGSFLIHDGPDSPRDEVFASIGCIEVMGPDGFVEFNNLLIELSGPPAAPRDQQLAEIGKAMNMSITYLKAERPPLKKKGF